MMQSVEGCLLQVPSVPCLSLSEFQHDNLRSEGQNEHCFAVSFETIPSCHIYWDPLTWAKEAWLIYAVMPTASLVYPSVDSNRWVHWLRKKDAIYGPDALATEGNEKGREYVHRPWMAYFQKPVEKSLAAFFESLVFRVVV